jgi:hypothetical protein
MAKLSSDNTYVTVEKGDTLSQIALTYSTYTGGVTYQILASRNDIDNPDRIYVGQKIMLTSSVKKSTNNTSKATIKHFGLQSNTERTVFATWTWTKSYTENYQVKWEYDTGDGIWFVGTNSTVDAKSPQSIYDAPTHAKRVRFYVKPISNKRTVNGRESNYWTAGWSTAKAYSFADNPPSKPNEPNVEKDKSKPLKIIASLNNIQGTASIIQFALYKDDTKYKTGKAAVKASAASFEFTLVAGSEYKVQCRAYGNGEYSDWSDFTNPIKTVPPTPKGFTKCILQGDDHDEVHLEWAACATANDYEIEYAQDQAVLGTTNNPNQPEKTGNVTVWDSGDRFKLGSDTDNAGQWFFRIRAVNDEGESDWSSISSTSLGKAPSAPTTWSSTNSATIGEPLTLYWVHNSTDNSSQTHARIKLTIDGVSETIDVTNSTDEDEKDKTSSHKIDTSKYKDGAAIDWSVATLGEGGDIYSEWSVTRRVYVYTKPDLELTITDHAGEDFNYVDDSVIPVLESFPFHVNAIASAGNNDIQVPIGFYVSIKPNDTYTTIDTTGNEKIVLAGESVYAKYIDSSNTLGILDMDFKASDVDLKNNVTYAITVLVSMNSGLTAEKSFEFTVAWIDDETVFEPNAEIMYDEDTYSTSIRPYCNDADGNLVENILLSVYRREFDGAFTEIATDIPNVVMDDDGNNLGNNRFILDPHPTLDFARYRVVARDGLTGKITYCDIQGYPIGCDAIIIQWDEAWSNFDTRGNEDILAEPAWTGSLLKLMYNIDTSEKTKRDVELIEYIGRSRPVSYYGTQLGNSATWNVEIPANDKETLYALRRLAIWMGNVYVREPSGSGYWASVDVSFSQKHNQLTIPVTINVTRVEGGV